MYRSAAFAAVVAIWTIAPAAAQEIVLLVCELDESYGYGQGRPIQWRHRGTETLVIDLGRQVRDGDGSCCFIRAPTSTIYVWPDKFAVYSTTNRDRVSIDRYTGRLNGERGRDYVRGTCRPGRRQF